MSSAQEFSRREELRSTFAGVAELYDRARPSYPAAIFRDIASLTGLAPPARVLEIGAGTGIATRGLADLGLSVVGVELDAEMAALARVKLSDLPGVEIVTANFEQYASSSSFNAVAAFSAFHWIDPATRYARVASLLGEGGSLVIADARLVVPEDADPFFSAVEVDYSDVLGQVANAPGAPDLASRSGEIDDSIVFKHLATRHYRWQVRHSAASYVELLDTMPWHRALPSPQRTVLYERIRYRINASADGVVAVTFDAILDVAARCVGP